jgi:DNA ligase-1
MKPMLASPVKGDITFPVLASPKIDGIRCLIIGGVAVSRSLKPIRNPHVQAMIGHGKWDGLDGELVVGSPTDPNCMQNTTHGVMSGSGEPDFKFHVFDDFTNQTHGFGQRLYDAHIRIRSHDVFLAKVAHRNVADQDELDEYEAACLEEGYEGVMVRSLDGPYKQGRATAKQGYLLKVKRFVDSEAVITGIEELMRNENEAKKNLLGRTERSTAKDGLVGGGVLGNLVVRDLETDIEFRIGTGFTAAQREEFWSQDLTGRIVTYKHFANAGVKDAPRFPVFKAFRDPEDMS